MNPQSSTTSDVLIVSRPPVGFDGIERLSAPTTADRLYQIAALTAGIFLLATLL